MREAERWDARNPYLGAGTDALSTSGAPGEGWRSKDYRGGSRGVFGIESHEVNADDEIGCRDMSRGVCTLRELVVAGA